MLPSGNKSVYLLLLSLLLYNTSNKLHRDRQKRTAYARVELNGSSFVHFSVESCGRLGQPAMELLHLIVDEAAASGVASRASFVAGALRELGVGLVRRNSLLYRAFHCMLARSSGISFHSGLSVPTDELDV
jgi:hypothetical protein